MSVMESPNISSPNPSLDREQWVKGDTGEVRYDYSPSKGHWEKDGVAEVRYDDSPSKGHWEKDGTAEVRYDDSPSKGKWDKECTAEVRYDDSVIILEEREVVCDEGHLAVRTGWASRRRYSKGTVSLPLSSPYGPRSPLN